MSGEQRGIKYMKEQLEELKKIITTEVKVRLVECDPYGVANHANYFVWFELGRFDYAKSMGYALTSLAADEEVIYITLRTKCKYIKSAHFEDELLIRTRLSRIPIMYAKYCFEQELYDKRTGNLLAKCQTENAAVDKDKQSILKIWDDESLMRLKKDEE